MRSACWTSVREQPDTSKILFPKELGATANDFNMTYPPMQSLRHAKTRHFMRKRDIYKFEAALAPRAAKFDGEIWYRLLKS